MHISNRDVALETRVSRRRSVSAEPGETNNPFDQMLNLSIRLRDLYRQARRRTSDDQLLQLRLIFDSHYREQVRIVDVLVDRARIMGGVGRIFAGA